jgi:SAM-dependent methyltransferase
MTGHHLRSCLCCGGSQLDRVLDLGVQPPANSYVEDLSQTITEFPLGLNICRQCWHAQLTYCVDRAAIFDHYHYVSGTSGTLIRFFQWFAQALEQCLPPQARVLELAANDGSLIRELVGAGFDATGVDPARNIVETAQAQGLPIECGYWPQAASKVAGGFDAIVCMNVVAHVDDPAAFIGACRDKLNPGGCLLVQPSQARMFGNGEFDTCYHEHISFFNMSSMRTLARSVGLELYDAVIVKIHGDSPVFILGRPDAPPPVERIAAALSQGEFALAERLGPYEDSIHLYDWATYEAFGSRAQAMLQQLRQVIDQHRAEGFEIVFVGAAAKAMTVINAAGVKPDWFLDEAPMKIGRYAPGVGVRVSPLDACRSLGRPALFLVTAWNFRHELAGKLRRLGVPEGSKFYAYFPSPAFFD